MFKTPISDQCHNHKESMESGQLVFNTNHLTGFHMMPTFRSSRPEVFCEKGVLRNFAKFRGKHLCQSLFFNKVADLRPATLLTKRLWHVTLLKKRLWHGCFPVNFAKFLWTPFLAEHLRWLLLNIGLTFVTFVSTYSWESLEMFSTAGVTKPTFGLSKVLFNEKNHDISKWYSRTTNLLIVLNDYCQNKNGKMSVI